MDVNKNIFREYDIRGVAGIEFPESLVKEYERLYGRFPGVTITLEVSRAIGKAYGAHTRSQGGERVLVGYEDRPHAEALQQAFVDGILEAGIDVLHIGKGTTPFVYFLTSHLGLDGGVNVTGSHNIFFFNGFKIMKKKTAPLYGAELQKLYEMIVNDDYGMASRRGRLSSFHEAYETYRDNVLERISVKKKLKVAIDSGNGSSGPFVMDFFKRLGTDVVAGLYLSPDAYYPNHVPDPELPHNVKVLQAVTKGCGADIGIALDADADRVGFVTEEGDFVYSDDILILLMKDAFERDPGKKIVFDVRLSSVIPELAKQYGGEAIMHRTGHSPFKDTLRKDSRIILGGESSGHYFFGGDYYRIDDGFYAAATVLSILSKTDEPFSRIIKRLPKRVRAPEIRLPCEDEHKHRIVGEIAERLNARYECIRVDGVRVVFDSSTWGLIRASNTTPYLSIKLEAETEEKFMRVKHVLADELERYKEIRDTLDRDCVYSNTGILGYR